MARVHEYEEQPQAPDLGATVQLETAESLVAPVGRDGLDAGYVPADWPFLLDEDNTASHLRDPETLEERLRRERQDVLTPLDDDGAEDDLGAELRLAGERRSGRIAAAYEAFDGMYARSLDGVDCGIDGGAASAEEAALYDLADAILFAGASVSTDSSTGMVITLPLDFGIEVPAPREPQVVYQQQIRRDVPEPS